MREYLPFCLAAMPSCFFSSVKPHVSDEEFRHVEFLCQQFATGEGKVLHEKLLAKVRTSRNWVKYFI